MFQADPRGILTIVAVAMCWTLAVVLRRVSERGSVARKLALLLVIEGVTLGPLAVGFLATSLGELARQYPMLSIGVTIVHTFGDCGMLALYPPFLAAALQTRITHPFANRNVRIGLVCTAGALFFLVLLSPELIGASLLYLSLMAVFAFALVASVQSWRTSSGVARSRAFIFMLAFGFRDLCWGFTYAVGLWEIWSGNVPVDEMGSDLIVYILGTLLAVPLTAYGILRTQMFDIDLRIRWTIKQSTLAAMVLAIMFVLTEGADRLLSSELGNWAGLVAAGIVVFLLAPLQRFADRVASAAMPNTRNTPEYAAFRKMQVYEAAIAEAQQGGGISDKERALLVRLRDSLGISESDADAIERDLQISLERIG